MLSMHPAVDCPVRPARSADLPVLLALEALFPGDRLSLRQLRHHLDSPTAAMRVVDCGDAIGGYSLLLFRQGSRVARLYSITVAPAFRGRGLGRLLLEDVCDGARTHGCSELRLEVRADNATAIALYQRVGFRLIGRRDGYYEDGAQALRFSLDLVAGQSVAAC